MPEDARLTGLINPDKILHFRPAIRKEKIARPQFEIERARRKIPGDLQFGPWPRLCVEQDGLRRVHAQRPYAIIIRKFAPDNRK
ncbi:hypothetical protein, partial [Akkermansia sp.]|uniref:hypothetical protein n=1 Tax=Akkermansia sp. TaxID=1872421 RepID=UPI003AB72186